MSLRDLLRNSWTILRRSRLIWVFSAIYGLYTLIDLVISRVYQSSSSNISSSCLKVFFILIFLFVESGMVYAANQEWLGQPVSFKDAWALFRDRIGSLIIVSITWGLSSFSLYFPFACVTIFFFSRNPTDSNPFLLIVLIIIISLTLPFVEFALRAVLLNQKWGFRSMGFGTQLLSGKYWKVFFIIFSGITLTMLAASAMYLTLLVLLHPEKLQTLAQYPLPQGWFLLSTSFIYRLASLIIGLVVSPLQSTMITLLYLDSARKINPPIDTPSPSPLPSTP